MSCGPCKTPLLWVYICVWHQMGPHLLAPTGSDFNRFGKLGTVLAGYVCTPLCWRHAWSVFRGGWVGYYLRLSSDT